MILEICCGEIGAVVAAGKGGAVRVELCSGLEEGGMTPSLGLIRSAVATGMPEINVLIRPRPGDFLYSDDEIAIMEDDIRMAIEAGATGVVIGALTADGNVDIPVCRRLIDAAGTAASHIGLKNLNITFHRAFDVCRDPHEALEAVIALGCDCLLTSGLEENAAKGIPMLRKLAFQAAGRICIIAGSGVNTSNAAEILEKSGVDGIHSTARILSRSGMKHRACGVCFGEDRLITSPDLVANLAKTGDAHRRVP